MEHLRKEPSYTADGNNFFKYLVNKLFRKILFVQKENSLNARVNLW